jgi:hypothetical protein
VLLGLLGLFCLVGAVVGGAPGLIALGALAMIVFGGVTIYRPTESFGWRVTLHEGGISSRDNRREGCAELKKPRDITWDEVAAVRTSITTYVKGLLARETYEFHTLLLKDGSEFTLTNRLRGVRKLAGAIQEQVFERLLPQTIEAFNTGEVVDFGAIKISHLGLEVSGQTLPWDAVAHVGMHQGTIHVSLAGGRSGPTAEAAQTSNLPILWALLRQILGPQRIR